MLKKIVLPPIRMCIHCRGRFVQGTLYRLQCVQDSSLPVKRITPYSGQGRSFYLCSECVDNVKASQSLCRVCKIDRKQKEQIYQSLKEVICQHEKLESMKSPES